ncbi:ORFY protein [Cacao swollen shoot Ghana J virus]|uniref:ORFY protein n=1 Tax=Cacao swollen shoot Ghana J virus TaxID=2056880 RepID=UPI000CA216F3|nr:ORFY protein [Cacao swollen shoot Ghana J virus]ATZ69469.1 ORFY protein [Cacao swollen shoot Ghana J virus]
MESIPDGNQTRRACEIPATQLNGASYPFSLAYDGLLQQRQDVITHGTLSLSKDTAIQSQLYKIEEQAAREALKALHDFQGILHHKRAYLHSSATRDNWAGDRLPGVRQASENLDLYSAAIASIIEQVVQP